MQDLRAAIVERLGAPPAFPAERFAERGIVICAGGQRYFTCVWILISALRHYHNCTLPIQVWHLGRNEMSEAMRLMLDDCAYGLSRRRVTLSTAGLVPGIDRLREACPVALAVSLHAPNDALRDELVPINRKYPIRELLAACQRYLTKAPRDFVTFEYVMLADVNDSVAQARELAGLVREVPCKINLIPFNPFPGVDYRRSAPEAIARFRDVLMQAGLVATVRKTRGDDIAAACGQLAGRVLDRTRRTRGRQQELAR